MKTPPEEEKREKGAGSLEQTQQLCCRVRDYFCYSETLGADCNLSYCRDSTGGFIHRCRQNFAFDIAKLTEAWKAGE